MIELIIVVGFLFVYKVFIEDYLTDIRAKKGIRNATNHNEILEELNNTLYYSKKVIIQIDIPVGYVKCQNEKCKKDIEEILKKVQATRAKAVAIIEQYES